jgi:UPF0755 protein
MPRDPRVDKFQRLRNERFTRASGTHYGTRATAQGNVQSGPRHRNAGRTLLSLIVFVALVIVGLYAGVQYIVHGIRPAAAAQKRIVVFYVAPGESVAHLAARLENQGLIFNATIFHWYTRLDGIGGIIQSGPHTLSTDMNMDQVVQALSKVPAAAPTADVTIGPGWRAEQVAQALAGSHVASYQDTMNEIQRGNFSYAFLADRPAGAGVEGYLLPDTYTFRLFGGAHYALNRILRNYDLQVSRAVQEQGKQVYGSFYKAMTMASIVEREAGTEHDKALIASVYLNRLRDTSGAFAFLNADATLQYALGQPPNWWAPLTNTQLKSLYNTYTHRGLPPAPIAEPSAATIEATVSPAITRYFFYWHRNGSHGKSIFCTADQGATCAGTPQ